MPKTPKALAQLPTHTIAALQKLGADLAVARLRRKESLKSWSKRMGVSISTLQRLEAGDPSVSMGILASALWLINRDSALVEIAAPALDMHAIELSVREAEALGRARTRAAVEAQIRSKKHRFNGPTNP